MDIPFHKPAIGEEEIRAVTDCLRNGWLTMGGRTVEFEELFARRLGVRFAVAVNSGTAALHLALLAAGVSAGCEVIVPAMTFVSTAEVVRYLGAQPVLADVDPNTFLLDAEKIESKITAKTKAIIPVHYGGCPCDMDAINAVAKKYNLFVIEDAAHSLPAFYKGKPAGTLGQAGCFSFYATKTLATGEGGMIATDNEEWATLARSLRLHGITKDAWKRYTKDGNWRYDVLANGFKYNMTDISAAIGIEQLKKLNALNDKRRVLAERYTAAFAGKRGLIPYEVPVGADSSWHLYPLKVDSAASAISRDVLADRLKEQGIMTSVHFIPLYRFTTYKDEWQSKDFPGCEQAFATELSLPMFPDLSFGEQDEIIKSILALSGN